MLVLRHPGQAPFFFATKKAPELNQMLYIPMGCFIPILLFSLPHPEAFSFIERIPWQAWRSPASLLTKLVCGCHEIDHLKKSLFYYMNTISDLFSRQSSVSFTPSRTSPFLSLADHALPLLLILTA